MEPKISVIVPVYNTAPYLPRCLDSILAQTHGNLELLLVDDGSTDGSGGICDAYAARDCRIRVFHQANRGQSAARNKGLDSMTGEYVAFVDSDDAVSPDYLEKMLSALGTGGEMAVCNFRLIPGGDCPISDGCLTREEFLRKLTEPEAWFYATVTNKLLKWDVFRDLRFPEGYIHEDEAVIHRIAARCGKITLIGKPLYDYHRRSNSTMGQGMGIRSADKLHALADRILLSREMGWRELGEATALRYVHTFFDLYLGFPRNGENGKYFSRMEETLKQVLPALWRTKGISLRHKVYLTLIRIHPRLFFFLRKAKRGKNP